MGLPNCDKFPCMHSCRECREQIIAESLRTGKVCLDTCHEGYIIWGLPVTHEDNVVGGLIVFGGEKTGPEKAMPFEMACAELYSLAKEHGLIGGEGVHFVHNGHMVHRYIHRSAFSHLDRQLEAHARPMIDALQVAEFDNARQHFEAIREAFLATEDLPSDVVRGLLAKLIYRAHSLFVESGADAYACLSESGFLMDLLSKAGTKQHLTIALNRFFQRFVHLARPRTKDVDDLMVEKATTYLEEHLREELDRDKVAAAIGISPSHFSRLIREKKGRTFLDLLNQYRIEHAAKLMVRSSRTLADISAEAGFCDQSYFSKVFKRYKGESPARYRKSHQL